MAEKVTQKAKGKNILQIFIENFKLITLSTALIILSLILLYQNRKWIGYKIHDWQTEFVKSDTSSLKILYCHISEKSSNHEEELIRELSNMEASDSFNISFKQLYITSPKDSLKARNKALKKNADLIIWGYYRESKGGVLVPVLRYYLVKDILISESKKRGEDYLIFNPESKYEGFLTNNIKYVIHWVHGIAAYQQGDYKRALHHFKKINVEESLEGESYQFYQNLSEILLSIGEPEIAKLSQSKVLNILENTLPLDLDKKALANAYFTYSEILLNRGKLDSAAYYAESSLNVIKEIGSDDLNELKIFNLAALELTYSRKDKQRDYSCSCAYDALEIARNTPNLSPSTQALVFNDYATCLTEEEKLDSAVIYFKKAIFLRKKDIPINYINLARNYNNVAEVYESLEEFEKSFLYLDTCITIRRTFLNESNPDLANSYNTATRILNKQERYEEALKYIEEAIKIASNPLYFEKEKIRLLIYYNDKAVILMNLKKFRQALEWQFKAINFYYELAGRRTPHPRLINNLAVIYQMFGEAESNIGILDSAIILQNDILGLIPAGDTVDIAINEHGLAKSLYIKYELTCEADLLTKAVSLMKSSIDVKKNVPSEKGTSLAKSHLLLGKTYYKMDSLEQAENNTNDAIKIFKGIYLDENNSTFDEAKNLLKKIKQESHHNNLLLTTSHSHSH